MFVKHSDRTRVRQVWHPEFQVKHTPRAAQVSDSRHLESTCLLKCWSVGTTHLCNHSLGPVWANSFSWHSISLQRKDRCDSCPDNKGNISLWSKGWAGLLAVFKRLDLSMFRNPKLGCHNRVCTEFHPGPPLFHLHGLGGTNVNMKLMLIAVPWVMRSSVSDLGVSHLLSASLKLWQAPFLVCKQGKSQTLHNSWFLVSQKDTQPMILAPN